MDKKLAIMQPYFLPYIGYFQLIKSVDEFILYDNIQYTKKGWINRNRILVNGSDRLITLPVKKDSDYLNVVDREISNTWNTDKKNLLNLIKSSYSKAPYFKETYELLEECLGVEDTNLFEFIHQTLLKINRYVEIETPIVISSTIPIDHSLKSEEKVLSLCKAVGATMYINAIGGQHLYSKDRFAAHKIQLQFIKSDTIQYSQFNDNFVPWLSIVDVLMFNSKQDIIRYLNSYTLI
jgi:hypothetical protein